MKKKFFYIFRIFLFTTIYFTLMFFASGYEYPGWSFFLILFVFASALILTVNIVIESVLRLFKE